MHTPPQFLFDGLQLYPHAIPSGLPFDLEFAPASFTTDEDEAQEGEGLRFYPMRTFASAIGRSALCQHHTWWDLLDQLVGMSLQVLELGMEACGERVHRAAVGVVGGVGDELIVEAEARVG